MKLSLTKMIYAVSGGICLYALLEYFGQFRFDRMFFYGNYGPDLFLYVNSLCFVIAMLFVAVTSRFKVALFRWDDEPVSASATWLKSVALGLLGGAAALIIASPMFWFGSQTGVRHYWDYGRLGPMQLLIANALSPLRVLTLLLFLFALAVSSEIVFRGIVFRTFALYASIPAAGMASCLLFAFLFPVLGFIAAVILGITASVLYYKTKNLLAPIFANALFTVGGSGIVLYHRLM